jgi:HK97 gp10 family phage protein
VVYLSVKISVNLSNFDVLSSCFDCLCEQYPEAVAKAMNNVAQNILATANTLVPVRTGYLKSTLAIEQPSNFKLKVKATAPYAYYVEFGTRKMSPRLFLTNSVNQHLNEFALEIESKSKICYWVNYFLEQPSVIEVKKI